MVIAGAFLFWGINSLIQDGLGWWSFGSFILLGIGVAILVGQVRALTNRGKIRNIVKSEFEMNPNASVEEISENTGITKKDVQAVILDLKAQGELRGKFSSKTGQLKYGAPAPTQTQPQEVRDETPKYCPNCGTPIKSEESKFCQFCGAKVE